MYVGLRSWTGRSSHCFSGTTKHAGLNWTGPSSSRRKKRSSALDPHHPLVQRSVDPAKEIRASLSVSLPSPPPPPPPPSRLQTPRPFFPHLHPPAGSSQLSLPRSTPPPLSRTQTSIHSYLGLSVSPSWCIDDTISPFCENIPVHHFLGASSSSPSPSVPRYNTASTARLWNASIIPSFFILLLTGQLAPSSETNSPPLSNNSE